MYEPMNLQMYSSMMYRGDDCILLERKIRKLGPVEWVVLSMDDEVIQGDFVSFEYALMYVLEPHMKHICAPWKPNK